MVDMSDPSSEGVDTSTGIVGFDLLDILGATLLDPDTVPPYDGPTEIPEGCVVVDFGCECEVSECYLSDNGGHIVGSDTWRAYREALAAVEELAEEMRSLPYIPGWAQRGEPQPQPRSLPPGMFPQLAPLRNPIPRVVRGDDGP